MVVLITGFEPFGMDKMNASEVIVQELPERLGEIRIEKSVLPVVYGKALEGLYEAVIKHVPDVVLCLGQAAGRMDMGLERIAVNINHTDKPDNEGNRPIDERIRKGGPAAYFTNYPVQALLSVLDHVSIPVTLSCFAGTFLCNHVFYGLMDFIHLYRPSMYGGFIHVPLIAEQKELHPDKICFDKKQMTETIILVIKNFFRDKQIGQNSRKHDFGGNKTLVHKKF